MEKNKNNSEVDAIAFLVITSLIMSPALAYLVCKGASLLKSAIENHTLVVFSALVVLLVLVVNIVGRMDEKRNHIKRMERMDRAETTSKAA